MNKLLLVCLILICSPMNLWAAKAPPAPVYADLPTKELTGNHLEYYLRVFNHVMANHKTDKPYKWRTDSANGSISVGEEYRSRSGALCRNFAEGYIIAGKQGQAQGVACIRDDNKGWCRLKHEDAKTCALEGPQNLTEEVLEEADRVIEEGDAILRSTENWLNR